MNRLLVKMWTLGIARKSSDRKQEHVIKTWRKGDPCYIVTENLTDWCLSVMWKAELVNNELMYLAGLINMQSFEGIVWFFSFCLQ